LGTRKQKPRKGRRNGIVRRERNGKRAFRRSQRRDELAANTPVGKQSFQDNCVPKYNLGTRKPRKGRRNAIVRPEGNGVGLVKSV
jgi:hypothetical protein